MCGRFNLTAGSDLLAQLFELGEAPSVAPRYNIAPTQPLLALRLSPDGARSWAHLGWGLVPSWSKDPGMGARMINARAETAAEKPSFRAAFKRRRCLVPATGYYEWVAGEGGGPKTPYHVRRVDLGPFAMAGLWESWQGPEGSELKTATILTTGPNALIAPLHHRMPVILSRDAWGPWLGEVETSREDLQDLLVPSADEGFEAYAVSRYVNSPRNEGPTCIEPADASSGT